MDELLVVEIVDLTISYCLLVHGVELGQQFLCHFGPDEGFAPEDNYSVELLLGSQDRVAYWELGL